MLLVVDNGSVYSSTLIDFLHSKKFEFTMKSNSNLELNELSEFDSLNQFMSKQVCRYVD